MLSHEMLRHRPADEDEDPRASLPPWVKEPEPDIPEPGDEDGDFQAPVPTL
ncbi:MAG TPA: hypothetical protein VH596_00800 [Terriglobales bacterium]|jgi:hypothetical protein